MTMAYSTFSAPAQAGFTLTTAAVAVGSGITGFFARVARAIAAASSGQARLDEATRLRAKTDAELAELGITRDDIIHHVFRDLMWH